MNLVKQKLEYECDRCGSKEIETMCYISINKRIILDGKEYGSIGEDSDDAWCNECEEHISVMPSKEK